MRRPSTMRQPAAWPMPSHASVRFERVNTPRGVWFEQAYRLYVKSFPPGERCPKSYIRRWMKEGYELTIAQDWKRPGKPVVFLALAWWLPKLPVLFLDYLATASSHGGNGIASAYLESLKARAARSAHTLALLMETRHVNKTPSRGLYAFYRKHGARRLDRVPFILAGFKPRERTAMTLLFVNWPSRVVPGNFVKRVCTDFYAASDEFATPAIRRRHERALNEFLPQIPDRVRLV